MENTTQSAFAKKVGFTRQYISTLIKKGVINLENGKINPEKAESRMRALTNYQGSKIKDAARGKSQKAVDKNQESNGRGASGLVDTDAIGYAEALAHKTTFQGKNEEVKFEKEIGQLVPVDEVVAEFEKAINACKSKILGMPSRAAPLLLNRESVVDITEVLNNIAKDLLNELANCYTTPG